MDNFIEMEYYTRLHYKLIQNTKVDGFMLVCMVCTSICIGQILCKQFILFIIKYKQSPLSFVMGVMLERKYIFNLIKRNNKYTSSSPKILYNF